VLFRRRRQAAPRRRRIRKLRFLALLATLFLVSLVSFTYGLVTAIASDLAKLEPKNQARPQQLGYIYASDGKTVLAVLRGAETRQVVSSEQIAPVMKQAIIAVEDRRFWEHKGVDTRGVLRAVWADIRNKEFVQGGSTITQQLVKNAYIEKERTISRKLKEAALAWQLEQRWSKDKILTAYLNTIYFGNGAYGIEMAARVYFHKRASALKLPEAALLAGLPASPGAYDPVTNPRRALTRRQTVLRLMLEQGLITRADRLAAENTPLPSPNSIGLPRLGGRSSYFAEYVKQQLVPYYGSGKVFGGGLRITTSIDPEIQELARTAIDKWLPSNRGPAAALVAVDPRDGRVLAMVGGRSFKKSQFNLAVQGERQSGSAFKPFVLAGALAQGISPETVFVSKPTLINLGDKLWSIANYEGSYLGTVDLWDATTHSDNAVYAQLTAQVGPANVRRTARALGIKSPLNAYFAIGLGVEAVNPLEMARSFATFANKGARVDGTVLGNLPRAVLKVQDGKIVDRNDPVQKQVLDPNDAAVLTAMLRNVIEEGTGRRADLGNRPAAGKTGTTENHGDAWFVGYTPQLAVAVWVGYPNKLRPMLTEFDGDPVAGGTFPALIWKTFMTKTLAALKEPPQEFALPEYRQAAAYQVAFRNNRWMLDNGNCQDTREVMYVIGYEPRQRAPCKPNEVDVPRVVGATLANAEERLLGMPLTPEVITRPARPGERLGIVLEQFPKSGTLSSWETVRIVLAKALHGRIPKLEGLPLIQAQRRLARLDLTAVIEGVAGGEPGVVLAQFPRAGRAAAPGMEIRIVVGRANA
jgi:penicillin-binding protein 1A